MGEATYPNDFNRAIVDLAPFGQKLFIGYGDATRNLGEKTPIEFRFFASPTEPTAQAAIVDGAGQGAPQTTPQQSGEEQIDRYRLLDGVLWQAGIDSIDADELHTQANTNPKGIQGNVYRLDGDTWRKFRSVNGGEHVHDLGSWKGAVYSVGSGADTRTEFEAGQVFRYLWRSTDQGKSFETVKRVEVAAAGQGDTRWVTLLPTEGALYLFGYESVFATNTSSLRNAVYDGQSVSDLPSTHALGKLYATSTLPLSDGSCLLFGLDVASPPAKSIAGRVSGDGSFTPLAAFAGSTVLDASLTDTGEVLYLVIAGEDDPTATSFDVRVLVAASGSSDSVTELHHFTTDVRPVSIAHFQGALFLGTGAGKVLRAQPTG
ncbi:MAG: hypothetical protein IPM35_38600 [Myxococcales bacterium]|nr:hypothetical protein [Myxococcales bacterium]